MPSKLFFQRQDPHHVYDWLLDGRISPGRLRNVRRGFFRLTSDFRFIRLLLIVLGDVVSACSLCRYSGQKVFVSEFNAITALALIYPLSFLFDLSEVHLNINHNLLNRREWPALAIMARRVKVCFIEASPALIARHPFVTNLAIVRPAERSTNVREVFAFSGNRKEQFLPDVRNYMNEMSQIASREHLDLQIIGALSGRRLSHEAYYRLFRKDVLVVLLYATENYDVRHSGIALHALAAGCPLIAQRSSLIDHYIDRGFFVQAFEDVDSFRRSLVAHVVDTQLKNVALYAGTGKV